ncbi:MAG: helix-turn-helix transcriptional regulator [Planctomycetes bacterium]|nr:helix-turn-helix transcriptional regulator [Planctomycetota bacterium]
MLNQPSIPQGHAMTGGVELARIWHVDGGEEYNILRRAPDNGRHIAIRTLDGLGRICLDSAGELDLEPDSFLVIEETEFYHYYCVPPRWHFWWFEFIYEKSEELPLDLVMNVPRGVGEEEELALVFESLMSGEDRRRDYACAHFNMLLHRWIAGGGREILKPHQRTVERITGMMQRKIADNWTVSQMAEEAKMSERGFRQAFRDITGESPKKYYDALRMRVGREMLRQGLYNVYEVANRLGFSNPFHFSKAYSRHFGTPPSGEK